jgi:hypothetical protein
VERLKLGIDAFVAGSRSVWGSGVHSWRCSAHIEGGRCSCEERGLSKLRVRIVDSAATKSSISRSHVLEVQAVVGVEVARAQIFRRDSNNMRTGLTLMVDTLGVAVGRHDANGSSVWNCAVRRVKNVQIL